MNEWLIRTVRALYTEACTVFKTYTGLSKSFEVKVGLHQGSVLMSLLFSAVMDVVSSKARSLLPHQPLSSPRPNGEHTRPTSSDHLLILIGLQTTSTSSPARHKTYINSKKADWCTCKNGNVYKKEEETL